MFNIICKWDNNKTDIYIYIYSHQKKGTLNYKTTDVGNNRNINKVFRKIFYFLLFNILYTSYITIFSNLNKMNSCLKWHGYC